MGLGSANAPCHPLRMIGPSVAVPPTPYRGRTRLAVAVLTVAALVTAIGIWVSKPISKRVAGWFCPNP
jgi:hypothetical protein